MKFHSIIENIRLQLEWIDSYPGTNPEENHSGEKYESRFSSTVKNIYIKNCQFLSINSVDFDGGAVYLNSESNSNGKVLFEEILFFDCHTSTTGSYNGGSIYFYYYGDCKFHFVSSHQCSSSN
jgi:hypothetical protein